MTGASDTGPVRLQAAVVANEQAGAYRRLVLHAPRVARTARPGQFVAFAVGGLPSASSERSSAGSGPATSMLLRRAVSLHAADPAGGTVQVVLAAHGPGSSWLCARRAGESVDLVGPLGVPLPQPAGDAVLVGGGYGSAPLVWLARELVAAGTGVRAVIGAGDADRLFGVPECAALGQVTVTTDDGSAGTRGLVTDVLPALLHPGVDVYACGPMAMLRAVAGIAAAQGARAWCTVEEAMACGIGVCMTCVLPVRGADGTTRMTRSCTDGPTFAGDALRWDAIASPGGTGSAVPADCHGAPTAVPPRSVVVAR